MIEFGKVLTLSVENDLSTVINCETLITLSFDKLDFLIESKMFPGAEDNLIFDVTTAAIIVLILLLLKLLD